MAHILKPRRPLKLMVMAMLATGALHSLGAQALGLVDAYQAALQNDQAYRAAFYSNEAGKENIVLGRSGLLPSISGSFSGSQNRTTVTTTGYKPQAEDYLSRSSVVQLRQPLFSLDSYARYKQGVAQSDYAAAQFESQQQEVIVRVVNAYLDTLYKSDLLALARAEYDLYTEQRKVNDLLFRKGEGTRTDMLETQARLDIAETALLETQDALVQSRAQLAAVIGGEVGTLDTLSPDFHVKPVDGVSFDAWKNIALERNPDIKTMVYGVEIARQEVNKARSGHAPRVDFVAVYSRGSSDSIQTYGQDTIVRSLGVQVNIPIFAGGAVNAQTRQAVAGQEKAKADLQAQKDKILLELHKDYDTMLSGAKRIEALNKAVASSEELVVATEKSVKGGVRINLDVLNARQQLFTNKRDLAQVKYNYLLNSLRMRASIGILSADDVREMASYFH